MGSIMWERSTDPGFVLQIRFVQVSSGPRPVQRRDGPEFASSRRIFRLVPLAGAGMTNSVAGNHSFSYQSLMPAGAGTPRYENSRRPHLPWIPAFAGMTSARGFQRTPE